MPTKRISNITLQFAALPLVVLLGGLATAKQTERLSRVPADSMLIVSVDVQAIRTQPELELLPWEVFAVASKEQLGFDASVIHTIDFAAGLPLAGPDLAATITTGSAMDITDLQLPDLGPTQTNKQNLKYREFSNPPVRIAQQDPKTIFAGVGASLNKMIMGNSTASSRALELAKESKDPMVVVVAIEKIRPILRDFLRNEGFTADIPPGFVKPLTELVENTQAVRLTSSAGLQAVLKLDLVAADAAAAKKIEQALGQMRDAGFELVDQQLSVAMNQPGTSESMQKAISSYAERVKQAVRKGAWKLENDRVHVELASSSTATIGILTGLLLPAVQSAREAARRMQSSNNLKQLILAFHNYHDANRRLPPRVIKDKDGEPLLSWRVAILPYIEQQKLYDQFHLDEPWDSEHNSKLIEKMPAIFASPLAGPLRGSSNYVYPYGEGLPGSEEVLSFVNVTDGTSNTIALVEVNLANAVPWTAPEDFDNDNEDLIDAFVTLAGTNVALFDGSVQFISRNIDEETLEAMLTHAGGEIWNVIRR